MNTLGQISGYKMKEYKRYCFWLHLRYSIQNNHNPKASYIFDEIKIRNDLPDGFMKVRKPISIIAIKQTTRIISVRLNIG